MTRRGGALWRIFSWEELIFSDASSKVLLIFKEKLSF